MAKRKKKPSINQINCFCRDDKTVFKDMFKVNASNCQCQLSKISRGKILKNSGNIPIKNVAVAID